MQIKRTHCYSCDENLVGRTVIIIIIIINIYIIISYIFTKYLGYRDILAVSNLLTIKISYPRLNRDDAKRVLTSTKEIILTVTFEGIEFMRS